MKKKISFIPIILILLISITGCSTKSEKQIKEMHDEIDSKVISCLENVLGGYITSEKNELKEISKYKFSIKNNKIDYYKGLYSDDNNIYVIVKTDESEVLKDFDLYFANKYEVYQTYHISNNIYIYIHTNSNDVNLKDLETCSSRNITKEKAKEMDSKVIDKLKITDQIIIKSEDNELIKISDEAVINEILDMISNSKQYEGAAQCDGTSITFNMYYNNNKIDTIYVWKDGRLIPASIQSGCGYYDISDNGISINELLERELNTRFYTLTDYSDTCAQELQFAYEDDNYKYYFPCLKNNRVLLHFDTTGLKMTVKYALNHNYIKPSSLLKAYPNLLIKEEKNKKDEELVKILDYIPNLVIDLKYATEDNFTGVKIYDNNDAYLRYGTTKKLLKVQNELNSMGYSLIIWDAYRPIAAQFKLWEIYPDSKYVANPNKGYSSHSKGNTIDISMIKLDGTKVEMPSDFDDFTKKADRNYNDVSKNAKNNAEMLEKIMKKYGFKGYSEEWWHYSDETNYEVIK